MARSARWRSYQHIPRLNIFLEIESTQCVIERIQNQGSFIDAPTRIADRVRHAQIPPRLEFTSDVYHSVLLDTRAIEKFRLGAASIVEDL